MYLIEESKKMESGHEKTINVIKKTSGRLELNVDNNIPGDSGSREMCFLKNKLVIGSYGPSSKCGLVVFGIVFVLISCFGNLPAVGAVTYVDDKTQNYLMNFGYLPPSNSEAGNLRSEDQLRDAIKTLQRFGNIPETGHIDEKTKELLRKPRCGLPDQIPEGSSSEHSGRSRIKRFVQQGSVWDHTDLTWSLMRPPADHDRHFVRSVLARGLQVWSDNSKLTFREVNSDKADIVISFARKQHDDNYPFDGRGQILAHAFFPGSGRGGDVHFDDDEIWLLGEVSEDDEGTSLFAVAAHEFGHALGLSHSAVEGALMYPWYQRLEPNFELPEDDRLGIQKIYGTKEDRIWGRIPPNLPTDPPRVYTTERPHNRPTRPRWPILNPAKPNYPDSPRYRPTSPPKEPFNPDRYYPERKPHYPDTRHNYPDRRQDYPERRPEVPERRPENPERRPEHPDRRPEHPDRRPEYPDRRPEYPDRRPNYRPDSPERYPYRPERRNPTTTTTTTTTARPRNPHEHPDRRTHRHNPENRPHIPFTRPHYTTTTARPYYPASTDSPYWPREEHPKKPHVPKKTYPEKPQYSPDPRLFTTEAPTTPKLPDTCNMNYDAIALIRGEVFIFKNQYLWRIGDAGIVDGFPTFINRMWPGLPDDLTHVDAVYEKPNGMIVFFIGNKYYLYDGNTLRGPPRPLTDLGLPYTLDHIKAVFVWGHNAKTYIYNETMYWKFDEEVGRVELDYPRDMSMWKGVGNNFDTVFQWKDGKTYFFKGKGFWKFDDLKMRVETPRQTLSGPFWMGCPDPRKRHSGVGNKEPYKGLPPSPTMALDSSKSSTFKSCTLTVTLVVALSMLFNVLDLT